MSEEEEERRGTGPKTYSARDARQGEIILKTPLRRKIFIAGLVGFVLLALLGGVLPRLL